MNYYLILMNNMNTVGGGYYGTEDYGTARALFAQTLDLFIFRALRDRDYGTPRKRQNKAKIEIFCSF